MPAHPLASAFQNFADAGLQGASPLYRRIASGIAQSPDLLGMATHKLDGQPAANIFLAAVHDLLLRGYAHPLRKHYPNLTDPPATGDSFPAFFDFCQTYRDEIIQLIRTRRTQTSEVNRCVLLLPAFAKIIERVGNTPLAMIDIGASAGFNLNWDKYSYTYGDALMWGDHASPLQLSTTLRGAAPSLPPKSVAIHSKIGLDLNPLDPTDPDTARWLRALIWPEETARANRLQRAIQTQRTHPVTMRAGDALTQLPALLAETAPHVVPIVYHSFVLYQFSPAARATILDILKAASQTRNLYRVSLEWYYGDSEHPKIELDIFEGGQHTNVLLGYCQAHGKWLEWLGTP